MLVLNYVTIFFTYNFNNLNANKQRIFYVTVNKYT